MNTRSKVTAAACILVVAAAAAVVYQGCTGRKGPSNVLLISIDTLRPDRLGYESGRADVSPHIDRLARGGVVFENSYSVSGWTLPSMATIMTGLYPRDHGATDLHYSMYIDLPTLATILRGRGYDTRGYVSHVFLTPAYGIAEGFRRYDFSVMNVGDPHEIASGKPLTDLVIDEVPGIEEPYFLWVHYFDPHFKYLPHWKWSKFGKTPMGRYDQEIAHTDDQIGRLLDRLDRRGLLDNTVVVVTSDHGEEFQEHDGKYHYTLYEEVARTPLIIAAPSLEPGVDDTRATQMDIFPTVLSLLGIDAEPFGELPGRDLFAEASSNTGEPVFMMRDRPPPYNQRAVIQRNFKLILVDEVDWSVIPERSHITNIEVTNVHPGIYLYDLEKDPQEKNNIYSEDHPKAKELLELLSGHLAGDTPRVREVKIDEAMQKKLRSLGYIR